MKTPLAPTKPNLAYVRDQLGLARDGYRLLEQKREILFMELTSLLEEVHLLETELDKRRKQAYASLWQLLLAQGRDDIAACALVTPVPCRVQQEVLLIAGLRFLRLDAVMQPPKLQYAALGSSACMDRAREDFGLLLQTLTRMASVQTIVWRLASEMRKTQRRVNALSKQIIPQMCETCMYIESVLEERDRESTFVLKSLKARKDPTTTL